MANAILNVGQTGGQINISTATAPATPAAGVVTLYAGTDKALHALNSDGVDITIAAAATGGNPISLIGTSLISTSIGATGGATGAIVIGQSARVPLDSNNDIAIGKGACALGSLAVPIQRNSLAIGINAYAFIGGVVVGHGSCAANLTTIALGIEACATGEGSMAIHRTAVASNNHAYAIGYGAIASGCRSNVFGILSTGSGAFSTALGAFSTASADCAIVIGKTSCSTAVDSITLGADSCSTAVNAITIGKSNKIFPGATGTMVFGNSSVGGTGACNSVVIGNSSQTTGINSVVIGNAECSSSPGSVLIGGTTNTLSSTGVNNTIINGESNCILTGNNGFISGSCSSRVGLGGANVAIGSILGNASGDTTTGIYSSYDSCITGASYRSAVIASYQGFMNASTGAFIIGSYGCVASSGYGGLLGGNLSCVCSSNVSVIIGGDTNKILAASNCSAIIGGCANTMSGKTNTVIIGGLAITADRSNTTYVQSLIAEGQAASRTNAVGSTGGTATLDWDNSNIQTLTLTDNITSLTKSNPIDGAVYTLFLTQGGSGGYTVAWGADVEWAGGTGPTLSTAIGAVDAVSLVYIAGVTGYYGNANLNFS